MKKIFLPALALLVFGGVSSAQVSQRQPAKTAGVVVTKPAVISKSMNKTASVTPAKTTKPATNKTVAIKRKHKQKARKPKKQ